MYIYIQISECFLSLIKLLVLIIPSGKLLLVNYVPYRNIFPPLLFKFVLSNITVDPFCIFKIIIILYMSMGSAYTSLISQPHGTKLRTLLPDSKSFISKYKYLPLTLTS